MEKGRRADEEALVSTQGTAKSVNGTNWPGMGYLIASKSITSGASYLQRKATGSICELETFPTYPVPASSLRPDRSPGGNRSIRQGKVNRDLWGVIKCASRARIGNGSRSNCLEAMRGTGPSGEDIDKEKNPVMEEPPRDFESSRIPRILSKSACGCVGIHLRSQAPAGIRTDRHADSSRSGCLHRNARKAA